MAKRPSSRKLPSRAPRRTPSVSRRNRRPSPTRVPAGASRDRSLSVGSGLAPGMHPITPYLAVANVTATMEFLERVLGFTRGVVLPEPDGQVRYAEMRHGESVVMLVRKGDAATPSGGAAAL